MAEKEYIERESLIKACKKIIHDRWNETTAPVSWSHAYADFIDDIKAQPTADVAPVRHGRWKKSKGNERPTENGFVHDDRYVCDCCGWGCCCETKLDFSFCPNCGARMDGDADA